MNKAKSLKEIGYNLYLTGTRPTDFRNYLFEIGLILHPVDMKELVEGFALCCFVSVSISQNETLLDQLLSNRKQRL